METILLYNPRIVYATEKSTKKERILSFGAETIEILIRKTIIVLKNKIRRL
jgi:hypothetical protein